MRSLRTVGVLDDRLEKALAILGVSSMYGLAQASNAATVRSEGLRRS